MTNFIIVLMVATLCGIAVTLQSAFMGTMTRAIGTLESVLITYGSGAIVIALIMFVARGGNLGAWRDVPPYTLTAGLLGLVIVGSIGFATARQGLIVTFAVILVAQYTTAALLDHFGLFGVMLRPLSGQRAMGILLLLAGAWLVLRDSSP